MYYLNKFCILCSSESKINLLQESDNKTISYFTSLLPELEYLTYDYPIYICANCESIVIAYNNLKNNCFVHYKRWKKYIDILQDNYDAEHGEVQIRIYKSDEQQQEADEFNDINLYIDNCDSTIINITCSESFADSNTTNSVEENEDTSDDEDISNLNNITSEQNTVAEKKLKCVCGRTFLTEETLEKHKMIHTNKFKCLLCDCGYARVFRLKLHYRDKHPGVEHPYFKLWKYKCKSCPMKYASRYLYEDHIKNTCSKKLNSSDKLKYICSRCNKIFETESALGFHLKRRHNFGIYECLLCQKKFLNKSGLTTHKNSHFTNKNKCKICNVTFKSSDKFNKHNIRYHENMLCDKCPYCDELCASTQKLEEHMKIHTDVTDEEYENDNIVNNNGEL